MKQFWNKLGDKQKPLFLFGLAIVIALVISTLTYGWFKQIAQSQNQARETQPVVVAAVDLTWGTSLTGDMVKVVPYLKESLPGGYYLGCLRSERPDDHLSGEGGRADFRVEAGSYDGLHGRRGRTRVTEEEGHGCQGGQGSRRVGLHPSREPCRRAGYPFQKRARQQPDDEDRPREHPRPGDWNGVGKDGQTGKTGPGRCDHPGGDSRGGREAGPCRLGGEAPACPRNFTDTDSSQTRGSTIPGLLAGQAAPQPAPKSGNKPVRVQRAASPSVTVELIRGSKVTETNFK